ncbi:MAG: Gfo/Idh/MocA family oxidoreductase, partial [Bryobacteraceae bacterium]|nr:Gfo/Idh/MocA family oxidoreductase [Bryobacteraceae bacterium]
MESPEQSGSNHGTTRRDFLKRSTVAASAAVAGIQSIATNAHAAGSDVIRVGMIGCGGRNAGAAVQALSADPGARLVAMCDILMDRVKTRREAIKGRMKDQVTVEDDHCFAGFDGYKHVIEASDVVLIANAAKFHPVHAMSALQAGKHVFVEKPHGIDPAGIKLMQRAAEAAQEKGLCLVSGLQSRYHTGYAETVQR